jgi:aminoglycoside phosphotransferase family enzyme/predicted kinase
MRTDATSAEAPGPTWAGLLPSPPGEPVSDGAGVAHSQDWHATVRETHSAVVVLLGDRAYKVKKPVDLGFLDFRTRESRQLACHRELALNRRMAPDVYLGVADLVGPDGAPCDHVLVMRRMPDDRRLARLVGEADVRGDIRRLARSVAVFHAAAQSSAEISRSGTQGALHDRWADNLRTLRELAPATVGRDTVDTIARLALRYVSGRGALLDSRIRAGLVRDGHGDLLADDIFCLPDGPRTLDCLDFDDHLRWMDVLDDVACLAMDLERLGAQGAAAALLDDYAEFSGLPQPQSLRHHYVAYRAVMRAKVAAIRADAQQGTGHEDDEVALLCRIGLDHLRAGRVKLILVGGPPGSGKTTVANALADTLPAAVFSSDRIRKELSGLAPESHHASAFGTGIYTAEQTSRTYAELARHCATSLAMGESVVVDASFTTAGSRAHFREVALTCAADLVELRCSTTADVLGARLSRRAEAPAALSDADLDIGRRLASLADDWPQAFVVDTGGSPTESTALARTALESGLDSVDLTTDPPLQ